MAIHVDSPVAIQMANLLQQHGADLDRQAQNGSTPLGLASRMVGTDLVQHLLQPGARKLGTQWCDTWTNPNSPVSLQVLILDQIRKSALGHPSRLRR